MCGILGRVGVGRGDPAIGLSALAHRGPDAGGAWAEGEVALVHRRLAIQDLSDAAAQPMVSASGRFVICYNGEVYNAPEIRCELEQLGVRFRSASDTEVLLEDFARRGTAAFARWNGMFALAIWDRQEQKLVLARDHWGIKPLYYTEANGQLWFSSEMRPLLEASGIERRLDARSLLEYLTFLWVPQPHSMIDGVMQLPPAHYVEYRWQEKRRTVSRYWDLTAARASDATRIPPRRPDAAAHLRSIFVEAVRRQLLSDVPIGAFLSGGLDSSMIVAAAKQLGVRAESYTVRFDSTNGFEGFAEDLPYARQVARHLDIPLHEVEVTTSGMIASISLLAGMDEPLADPAIFNTHAISAEAREDGNIVLLSGTGGDELFGGYRRYHAARLLELVSGRLRAPASSVARVVAGVMPANGSGKLGATSRRLRKLADVIALPPEEREISLQRWSSPETRDAVLSADWIPKVREFLPGRPHRESLSRVEGESILNRLRFLDLATFMPSLNLAYGDRMPMRVGVETRVPFLDLDLAQFAWALPPEMLIQNGTSKTLLKQAAEPWLPRDVIYRPKTGFGVPLREWMEGPLAELVGDVLSPTRLRRQGLFNPDGVQRVLTENSERHEDHTYFIWALLSFELWAETVLGCSRTTVPFAA